MTREPGLPAGLARTRRCRAPALLSLSSQGPLEGGAGVPAVIYRPVVPAHDQRLTHVEPERGCGKNVGGPPRATGRG